MTTDFYSHGGYPATGAAGASAAMRSELDLVEAGFAKLAALTGNGSKFLRVNSGATAYEALDVPSAVTALFSAVISPTQITSNQNDYNPTSLSSATAVRISTDASRDITGMQGGTAGRMILLANAGSFNAVLKAESGSSSAANRFALTYDFTLLPGWMALLWYDGTSSRWRLVGLQASAFIQTVLSAADASTAFSLLAAGAIALTGDISPSQITANQNDYNPTGLSTASVLRLSTDASRNITGIQGGADGRILKLLNVGSFPIVLKTADTGSSAANRFDFDTDLTLQPDQGVILYYDSTDSRWRAARTTNGEFRSVQVFTSTGANTWTKPAGLKRARVTVQAGGGAGGGGNNGGAGTLSAGQGGAGGGTSIKVIAAASLGATETATVGAGGTASSGGNGNVGGTSSFGSHCSATGGTGGTTSPGNSIYALGGVVGGVGSGGDINLTGAPGGPSGGEFSGAFYAGAGGASYFGGGGAAIANTTAAGNAGNSPGSGGGGSMTNNGAGNTAGGAGANGIIIVEEFF